jgi:hypothetical protein
MTHDILPTDIALAVKLVEEQRPDAEILEALAYRSVDPAKAAKVLDDLRHGRKPVADSPLPREMTMTRRPRTKKPGHESRDDDAPRSAEPDAPRERRSPAASGRRIPGLVKIAVASLLVLVIAAVAIVLSRRSNSESNAAVAPQVGSSGARQQQVRPPAPGTAVGAARDNKSIPVDKSIPVVLELQPDGLHFGGKLVTGDNLLSIVVDVLGAATRTNQAAPAGQVIYAYDRQGLLIYSQPGGLTNHIVLDCDAIGGPNGTTSPFAGTLKVEDQVIGPDTDSKTLASMKKLAIDSPKDGGTIWGGHYNSLGLIFAYLKSPQHPSLIEIDLK